MHRRNIVTWSIGSLSVAAIVLALAVPRAITPLLGSLIAGSQSRCGDLTNALAEAECRLRDWPDLGFYAELNQETPPPEPGETRVVFIGESITKQWGNAPSGGFFPDKPYINRGISGQTTPQMLIRFHPDVIALEPKVVVILAGTNDIAGNTGPTTLRAIEDNLAAMSEMAHAHGIRVVLASVLPVSNYHSRSDGTRVVQTRRRPLEKILALNRSIEEYAITTGRTYLDYHTALADARGMLRADLSDDGLHPNAKGYGIMTVLAERAIRRALLREPISAPP